MTLLDKGTVSVTLETYPYRLPIGGEEYNSDFCGICKEQIREGSPNWIDRDIEEREADRVINSPMYGGLVHADCYVKSVEGADNSTAWRAVALQVARYPSKYPASTIRAVITALLDDAKEPRR